MLGTETEYGITVRGDIGFNPAVASSLVVNSYPGDRVKVQWSYEEESPGRDARGFGHDAFGVVDPEGAVVNAVLANGARLYVDHAHPEYSGPECYDPLEAALYDKVGEVVMRGRREPPPRSPAGTEVSRLQEQLGREGELLRRSRELSALAGDPIRRRDPLRHHLSRDPPDLHRRRQGRVGERPSRCRLSS